VRSVSGGELKASLIGVALMQHDGPKVGGYRVIRPLEVIAASLQPPAPAASPAPSVAQSRGLAEVFLRAAVRGDRHALYQKMSQKFRSSVTEAEFDKVAETMNERFGLLQSFDFKSAGVGASLSLSGVSRVQNLMYAVETSKYPKGTHFAAIELVEEPAGLAVGKYLIMTFPLGAPASFK
jgi:hypothetical protein